MYSTYFLQSLNEYSNLITATLTLAIIYLTSITIKSTNDSTRLNALPIFFSKIHTTSNTTTFILENHSNFPAYDVDIFIIGQYWETKIPYKSLLNKKYKKDINIDFTKSLFDFDEGYGIVDGIIHFAFPPKTKHEMELYFIIPPETVQVVIQFRDPMGHNYLYQGWLHTETSNQNKNIFTLGSLKNNFKTAKRINLNSSRKLGEVFEIFGYTDHLFFPRRILRLIPIILKICFEKIKFRFYIKKEIRETLSKSFPVAYQKNIKPFQVEGRGEYTDL